MMSVEGDSPDAGPAGARSSGAKGSGPVGGARSIAGYEIQDTLGKGMSGKVKRGVNPASRKAVALKIIDKQTTPRRVLQVGCILARRRSVGRWPVRACMAPRRDPLLNPPCALHRSLCV